MTAGVAERKRPGARRVLAYATLVAAAATAVTLVAVRPHRPPHTPQTAPPPAATVDARATANYLAALDVRRFERQGTDYTNPAYSPVRLGKPLDQLDTVYDYDFPRLAAVARRLEGVDRRAVLGAIFEQVTRGCRTNTDRHRAVLRFLHKASNHNLIQPMWPDRTVVYDPLILLELGEMRCGQVNRLAVDLFRAAGLDGRIVQVAFHVSAEVHYDGDWHFMDADAWGAGEVVIDPDGTIPSVAELSRDPARLDALAAYWEPDWRNSTRDDQTWYHPSWIFFAEEAYRASGVRPTVYLKTATPAQEQASRDYGWNYYQAADDPDRRLWPDLGRHPLPRAPVLQTCERTGRSVELTWGPDPAAAGYWVFVGRRSRGWYYDDPAALAPAVQALESSARGWRPEDYEARFAVPPAEVARLDVSEPRARFDLPAGGGPVYVTVMPYDAHGRAAGRRVFPMSEELRLAP